MAAVLTAGTLALLLAVPLGIFIADNPHASALVMLALSMVVIAGMVGSGGLGGVITTSFSRIQVGTGFGCGIAVVIRPGGAGAKTVAALR